MYLQAMKDMWRFILKFRFYKLDTDNQIALLR